MKCRGKWAESVSIGIGVGRFGKKKKQSEEEEEEEEEGASWLLIRGDEKKVERQGYERIFVKDPLSPGHRMRPF